jgi:ABC-2 type transport system ATP-binding protein
MVGGFDVARQPLQVRSVSSLVFQDPVVDRTLTGRRNLEIHARLWAADARRIESTARALGVAEILDRTVSTYSGGQRRRLEIARALTSRPSVLFLDEPTVGLDPRIRHELVDVIARLRNHSDVTILLTTHYLDEAERLCDRVAVMHAGRIAAVDTPKALLAGLGAEVLEVRVSGDPDEAVDALRARRIAGADTFVVGQTVTVPLHGKRSSRVLAIVGQLGLRASAVTTRAPTLDDVYLRLTGDRLAEAV